MNNKFSDNKKIWTITVLILTAILIIFLIFMLKSCAKVIPDTMSITSVEGPPTVPEPVEGTEPVEGPPTVPVLVEGTEPVEGSEPIEGTELVEGHTHHYNRWVSKEATCTVQGVKAYNCSCGSSYSESIPALGHAWHEESVLLKAAWDETVKVKDAWDETVKVKDAWDEKVKLKDAWDETVVVKAAWDEQVLIKEATPAWDEQVLVREAWTEYVQDYRWFCEECGFDFTLYWREHGMYGTDGKVTQVAIDFRDEHTMEHARNGGSSASYSTYISIPVEHPAEYTTVHHEAIPAQYKTVHHEAETKTVHHEAEYKSVHHEAESKTVHHEAEYKTIHHEAEYEKQRTCTRCGAKK